MGKQQIIKEIIEDLLAIRQKKYDEYIDLLIEKEWATDAMNDGGGSSVWKEILHEVEGTKERDAKDIEDDFISEFDVPLVKLNNLLSEAERNDEVLEIEKRMARLHSKQFIGVKDFAEKYNDSPSTQKQYRSRLYDPLPYHQKVAGGKIMYIVDEVEKWRANNDK